MNKHAPPARLLLVPDAASADDPSERDHLARALRALAHPARLAVLELLAGAEGCVCGEIVRTLPLAQSTVSQHLKVLVEAGLVRSKTEGVRSSYCIDREAMGRLRADLDRLFSGFSAGAACRSTGAGR